jgi:cephalosporin-C deacetylase
MAFCDMPLAELERYKPKLREPKDFDAFWKRTLDEARAKAGAPIFARKDTPLTTVDSYDVTYRGFGGHPIKAWFTVPAGAKGPLPCVVEFIGYGGGRGFAWDWLLWASAGYAHFVMDTRGMGAGWMAGETEDPGDGGAPSHSGFMTKGIQDKESYYYRRVFTDAVRAVETARAHPLVDPKRVALSGGSQGGGISLAVAGLLPDVQACLPDVPFLCHYERATTITDGYPYQEIAKYLQVHRTQVDKVYTTLAYFDGVNFSKRAKAPALFSVGLMDEICPPSTVYAAYNHYKGKKQIRVWTYNHHEGGGSFQAGEKLAFLGPLFGLPKGAAGR